MNKHSTTGWKKSLFHANILKADSDRRNTFHLKCCCQMPTHPTVSYRWCSFRHIWHHECITLSDRQGQKLGGVPLFPTYLGYQAAWNAWYENLSQRESGHPRLQLYMYTCSWPEWSTSEQAGNFPQVFLWMDENWCSWQFGRQLWLPLGMGPKFEGPKLSSFVFALTRHQSRAVAEFLVFGAWTFALRVTRWAV